MMKTSEVLTALIKDVYTLIPESSDWFILRWDRYSTGIYSNHAMIKFKPKLTICYKIK